MKRKVCQVGPATLMVSLPSKWVKSNNINKGDEVDVVDNGKSLEINSIGYSSDLRIKLDLEKSTLSNLKSVISNAYKKGYDKITISYTDETILKDIQKVVDSLLGVEIVSSNKKQCEIKNIAQELESEFKQIFKKSFILLLELSQDIFSYLKEKDVNKWDDISYKKETITRHTDFCKRVLNKYKRHESETIFEYLIVWGIEKIANEYRYIYYYYINHSPKNLSSAMFDFFKKTNELLGSYYHAYYEKNTKKVELLAKNKDNLLFKKYYNLQKKMTSEDQPVLHHLANIIRRVWDISGPFYGLNS